MRNKCLRNRYIVTAWLNNSSILYYLSYSHIPCIQTIIQLQRVSNLDVELKDETDESLLEATAYIHKQAKGELEKLLAEADGMGKGDILRQTWKQDVEERIQFQGDQRRMVCTVCV